MKRLSVFLIIMALLMCGCAPDGAAANIETPVESPAAAEPTASPEPSLPPELESLLDENDAAWLEKHEREWMIGRLIIPSVSIDVALFIHGYGADAAEIRQNVCDAEDSAILYSDGVGNIIADHNNQGFVSLPEIREGDRAYILAGDCIVTLECDLVTDGINTGEGITDTSGKWVSADEDFTLYTCGENWVNIKIAGFKEIEEVIFEESSLPEYKGEAKTTEPEEVFDKYLDEYLQ